MTRRPPRWATRILERLLPAWQRDEVLGDLGEEFQRRGAGIRAWAWYWHDTVELVARTRLPGMIEGAARDLRLGVRQAIADPGFAAVTVSALALGIGLNAGVLAVADDVLLSPLPYPDDERLAVLTNDHTGSTTGDFGVSFNNMRDVAASGRTFDAHASYIDWQEVTYSSTDASLRIPAAFVDQEYFRLLGLAPEVGRLLRDDENETSAARVAVLSHGAWTRLFGADPATVGSVARLNGRPYEIVGVLADDRGDLRYRWGESPVGIFLPLFSAEDLVGFDLDTDRGFRVMNALLRLRPGVSIDAARRELAAVSEALTQEHPEANEGWRYHLQPLQQAFYEDLRGPTRALIGGSVLVLLLVTVNVITLVLIRATGRRREMALRRALGAKPGRLVRQLLAESMVLAVAAGMLGQLVAAWAVGLVAASGALELPSFASVRLEGWIFVTSAVLTVAAGIAFGSAAAVAVFGGSGSHSLDTMRLSEGKTGGRIRSGLVAAEVALAFVLLVGAGLMLSSFQRLARTSYGFETDNLLLARVDARGSEYQPEQLRALADSLAAGGAALPGVREAFIWSPNRLGHGNLVELLTRESRFADHPEERIEASQHAVRPGTLSKLGIPLLAGRDVTEFDGPEAPRVALVSETLARELWPDQNPIGRRMETVDRGEPLRVEVIGVTADAHHRTRLIDPFGPQRDVYYPFAQTPWPTMTLAVRLVAGIESEPVARGLRQLVREVDADLPVYEVGTMAERMRAEESEARMTAGVVLLYAVMALALAVLGVYGVLAHAVRRRRREIGIRMALGADPRVLLAAVFRQGIVPVIAGAGCGFVGAVLAARGLESVLYGVPAFDPRTFLTVSSILAIAAAAALYLPARRASRTDPVLVLRVE